MTRDSKWNRGQIVARNKDVVRQIGFAPRVGQSLKLPGIPQVSLYQLTVDRLIKLARSELQDSNYEVIGAP